MRVFSGLLRSWTLDVGRWALGVAFLLLILALAAIHPPSAIALFFLPLLFSPVALSYLCVNPALLQVNTDSPAGQSIKFGCQDVTVPVIGGGTQLFVMEAFNLTQFDSDWIVTNNSSGNPNKQKGQQKVPEYEVTLQLPGGATPKCPIGFGEFTAIDMGGQTITWIIAKVVGAGSNDGSATKFTVGLRYKLN